MIAREFPPQSGGIGYYVYYLSKKLRERGAEITVITRGSAGKTVKKVVNGVNVFYVSFFPLYPFHVWIHGAFVNRLLKSLEPKLTLVNLHSPLPPPIKTSLPIITTVHSPSKRLRNVRPREIYDFKSLADQMQSMFVYPPIESKVFNLSTKITTVSLSVAMELKNYGLDPDKITVVGNGVDEKAFAPIQNKRCTEEYVLFTGVLRAGKGLFDFVECGRQVCKVRPDVKFVICGSGPFLGKLKEKVRILGLQRQIVFTGFADRNRLRKIYQNATVHVIPSYHEGLPSVLLEAMSCGLPVVATNVGGINEVISSGTNGFLVPPKSPKLMAEIILKLLDDCMLRKKIGEAARKTIEKRYTWDKVADNVIKCYEDVLMNAL
jgi:glycosyltransferase involved in cell wall biosynthesis